MIVTGPSAPADPWASGFSSPDPQDAATSPSPTTNTSPSPRRAVLISTLSLGHLPHTVGTRTDPRNSSMEDCKKSTTTSETLIAEQGGPVVGTEPAGPSSASQSGVDPIRREAGSATREPWG
ncbi:hypothetical protein GCM10009743_59810 [Kribbella swartbergensis]